MTHPPFFDNKANVVKDIPAGEQVAEVAAQRDLGARRKGGSYGGTASSTRRMR